MECDDLVEFSEKSKITSSARVFVVKCDDRWSLDGATKDLSILLTDSSRNTIGTPQHNFITTDFRSLPTPAHLHKIAIFMTEK